MWQSPPIEFSVNGLYGGELRGAVKREGKKNVACNKAFQEEAAGKEGDARVKKRRVGTYRHPSTALWINTRRSGQLERSVGWKNIGPPGKDRGGRGESN